MKKLVIAVDGTAGSGKSVTFQKVAEKLNYEFIDTGLMYRAFTLLGIWENIDFLNTEQILELIPKFNYEIKNNRVFLNKKDVTDQLQNSNIIKFINKVTVLPQIRAMMVDKQKKMVQKKGVVMVGRDITSVVLPDADLKIYLDSGLKTRAARRYEQNLQQGIKDVSLLEIQQAIKIRDENDKTRQVGALKQVKDAWVIDNSQLTIDETVAMVIEKIKKMELEKNG